MKTNRTQHKKYLVFALMLVFSFSLLFPWYLRAQTTVPQQTEPQTETPPPITFCDIGGVANIGDLFQTLFICGLGFVGIASVIVLVAGGVWYMTAGDNENKVKQARTWMGNAVFGLVLALLSWLILFTINPDLVRRADFKNIKQIGLVETPLVEIPQQVDLLSFQKLCQQQGGTLTDQNCVKNGTSFDARLLCTSLGGQWQGSACALSKITSESEAQKPPQTTSITNEDLCKQKNGIPYPRISFCHIQGKDAVTFSDLCEKYSGGRWLGGTCVIRKQ